MGRESERRPGTKRARCFLKRQRMVKRTSAWKASLVKASEIIATGMLRPFIESHMFKDRKFNPIII
tara:strand:+ start:203 stop:400 length:198 start_codon:yes stop_codon:yes gene_type:complete